MDQQLLDDLALVFAEAAIRRFLAEQAAAEQRDREPVTSTEPQQMTKTPAASQKAQP